MIVWKTARTALLTVALGMASLLAPQSVLAQDASAEPAYDYSDLQVTPSSAVMAMATPEAGAATPEADAGITGTIIGDPEAPVTMAIYADFQCPHCRTLHAEFEPMIIEDFVRTGMVKLELISFPVIGMEQVDDVYDDSKESVQAAEAVQCAAEQDAFMPYREALYAGDLEPNSGALSDDNLKALAGEIGLNQEAFDACLDSGRYEDFIHAGLVEGLELGVSATPTFIINGDVTLMPQGGYDALAEQLNEAYEAATQ